MNNFRILNLGLDPDIMNKNSRSFERQLDHSRLCRQYHMLVLCSGKDFHSENFYIYSSAGSNKLSRLLRAWQRAKSIIVKNKIDIISSQDQYFVGLLAVLLARKYDLGVEIQVHGFEGTNFFRKLLARYVLSQADSIRTVSLRLVKKLVNDFNVDPIIVTEVPIFTDLSSFSKDKNLANIRQKYPDTDIIFLSVQRLVPIKRVDLQLRALAWLKQKYPQKSFKLIVVGDGPEKNKLIQQVESLNLSKEVEFVGKQENLISYYQSTDVLLLTSDQEGWGLVAVEALACGLPVIMTDVGLAGEIVKNNINGLVVPVGNFSKLTEVLDSFVNNPILFEKLKTGSQESLTDKLLNKEDTNLKYLKSWQQAYVKNKSK